MAKTVGLKVARMEYVNSFGFVSWWLNARFFQKMNHVESAEAYQDVTQTGSGHWLSRLERWVGMPFGQDLFAVLERPA